MYRIIDDRGTGKTSRLMLLAKENNAVFVCANPNSMEYKAKAYGISGITFVSYGDFILQDEVIGAVGSSGSSTGPHCHIEMYYLGNGDLYDYVAEEEDRTIID